MRPISFKRHRFPPDVIRHVVWLYYRFTLSIRDVEELLAQRGVEVSREAVRCWVNKFGPLMAANVRKRRGPPTGRWHLDEMFVKIGGRRMYLWRAVDDEGEVLDVLVRCCQSNAHSSPLWPPPGLCGEGFRWAFHSSGTGFRADVIRHAVWLYFRFTLSLRDVEEMLAERGIEVSYETIRCWTKKFGPQFTRRLKKLRPATSSRWHLDEMVCTVGGRRMYLWRAVDDEGEVLDLVMQRKRDTEAALTLIKRLLRNQRTKPTAIVTDGLASYPAALAKLDLLDVHRPGRLRENNRAENSHLPIRRRERKQQGFKSQSSAQRFLAVHAAVYNTFYTARHLTRRPTLKVLRAEAFWAWSRATCA